MKPSTPVGQALAKAFASQKATTQKTPQAVLREAETKAKAARQAAKPGVEPWRFAVDYRLDSLREQYHLEWRIEFGVGEQFRLWRCRVPTRAADGSVG